MFPSGNLTGFKNNGQLIQQQTNIQGQHHQ